MYARLHSLREESIKTVEVLFYAQRSAPSLSRLLQVSQIDSSGGGSSGRALFDDVVAGVTLQQLQVCRAIHSVVLIEKPSLHASNAGLHLQRGLRRDSRRPCDARAVVIDRSLLHSSSSSPSSNGSSSACATADGQSLALSLSYSQL